jgi:hypothetical protein
MFTHTFDNGTKTAVINPETGVVYVTPSGRTYGFPSEVVIENRQRVFKNYSMTVFKTFDFTQIEWCEELGPNKREGALFIKVQGYGVTFKHITRLDN